MSMASFKRKVKRQRAKSNRRQWRVRIKGHLNEFYLKPRWWKDISALNKLYRSLEKE